MCANGRLLERPEPGQGRTATNDDQPARVRTRRSALLRARRWVASVIAVDLLSLNAGGCGPGRAIGDPLFCAEDFAFPLLQACGPRPVPGRRADERPSERRATASSFALRRAVAHATRRWRIRYARNPRSVWVKLARFGNTTFRSAALAPIHFDSVAAYWSIEWSGMRRPCPASSGLPVPSCMLWNVP